MDLTGCRQRTPRPRSGRVRCGWRRGPARGALQVGLPPGTGKHELRVHDACGRLVTRAVVPAGSPQAALDLRDLQPGVYYVSTAGAGTVPVVVVR